jgi:hypothetical protein
MCIIAICDSLHLPKDNFKKCFTSNRDGFGFAWNENGKVQYIKGLMKEDEAWEIYSKFAKKNLFPYILHFRLGSPVIPELTHPFIINEDSNLYLDSSSARKKGETFNNVLFHNGIISDWKVMLVNMFMHNGKIPYDEWSDTRMVAIMINKLGKDILNFVSGKYVIFGKDKMFVDGDFEEDKDLKGIRFSNSSYKVYRYKNEQKKDYSNFHSNMQESLLSTADNLDKLDMFIV